MKLTQEQFKNGALISVAMVFAMSGAGLLQEQPEIGTTFLLLSVTIIFIREILKKL